MKLADYIQVAVDNAHQRPDYLLLGTKEILEMGSDILFDQHTGVRRFYGMTIIFADMQSHVSYGYRYPPGRHE